MFLVISHLCKVTRRNEAKMEYIGSLESSVRQQGCRLPLDLEQEATAYGSYHSAQ